MRSSRISCLLQEAWLDLPKVRMHRGIKPIEMLVQAQSVAYLAALDDSLVHRRSEATALLAHLSLLAWSATGETAPGLHHGQKVCPTGALS